MVSGANITPEVPRLTLPILGSELERPRPIAAAALSPAPATTGRPSGRPVS